MNAREIIGGVISKADRGDFDAEGEENPGGLVCLGGVLV